MDAEPQGWPQPSLAECTSLEHGHWSPRARHLIGEVHALALQHLDRAMRQCASAIEQQLYAQADRARNHQDQQRAFHSMQRWQQARPQVLKHMLTLIGDGFRQMDQVRTTAPTTIGNLTLSLLDRDEHEENAAMEKIVARGESRHGPALFELGYRMAVLVATAPMEGETLPLGPHALAHAFRRASVSLQLPIEHHLLALQVFEQNVMHDVGILFDAVNALLIREGILRSLRAFPTVRQPSRNGSAAAGAPEGPASSSTGQATAASSPSASATTTATHGDHIAVLEGLRDLLAQRRGHPGVSLSGDRSATADELHIALSAVQQHVSAVSDHASRELRSAQRLRDELLTQLNMGRPAGTPRTRLSPEQGDTVELMAMLFEQLHRQMRPSSSVRGVLSDLQVPLLRMAVVDRNFFEQQEHPARKLLAAVAEAANEWLDTGDDDADRALARKLDQLVARTRQEAPSTGLYTSLLADIEHHLGLLARKAHIAERRQVEAMQGRDRLEQVRRRATEWMTQRFADAPPRGLLRTLLERAWCDVLALTLLRHGEDSEAFAARSHVTDQLLGRSPITDRVALQAEVQNGLQQIGMHADEAEQVSQRLLGTNLATPAQDEALSATSLAMKLKQHQRLGGHAGESAMRKPHPPASPPATSGRPIDPHQQRIAERLRQLPFGSWFEFTDASGQTRQRKLAWYSPVSGHCLFVTRRGQRGDDMHLDDLARALAHGEARELEATREHLLDRAWHALSANLRPWTSRKRTP